MTFTLRPAISSDREFLFTLFIQTMKLVVEQTWSWDNEWQRADFDRRFSSYTVSIIEINEQAIGGLFVEDSEGSVFVHELQLLPALQNRGVGTAVMRGVIDRATRRGVPVDLTVVPANHRAQRFYERLGFEVIGTDSPFIRMRRDPTRAERDT